MVYVLTFRDLLDEISRFVMYKNSVSFLTQDHIFLYLFSLNSLAVPVNGHRQMPVQTPQSTPFSHTIKTMFQVHKESPLFPQFSLQNYRFHIYRSQNPFLLFFGDTNKTQEKKKKKT